MLPVLLRASIDGALVVGLIWILIRALPRLTPATRTALWWLATAKFLVALAWIPPIALPVLPASDAFPPAMARIAQRAAPVAAAVDSSSRAEPPGVQRSKGIDAPGIALLAAWALGLLASARLGIRRWQQTRAVLRESSPAPATVQAIAAEIAIRLGLRQVPGVRVSSDVQSPLVVGLRRPIVLLPSHRFAALSDRQLRMTLCHELAHVRRRDLWLGCIPAIAERVFFFHPLVHLAAREYVFWREAACDADVLDALDAAPQEYGRLLLDLGIVHRHAGLAAAGAPWSFSNLKRRIAMLHDPARRSIRSRLIAAAAVTAAVAAIVPLTLVASRASGVAAAPVTQTGATERDRKSELRFVMFLDEDRTAMSGSSADIERARSFRRAGERLLWFRQAGKEYVVRDPALLQQAEDAWKPLGAIGEEQGRIGAHQGRLGGRQGAIGAKQAEIGVEQGSLGARQGVLGLRQGALAMRESLRVQTAAEKDASDKERRQIDAEMRELDRAMRLLDARMRELEKPMLELGAEMEALGSEMAILGKQMEEAAQKAEAELNLLLERAIQTGAAEVVK